LIREAVAETVSSDAAKRFDNYVPYVENIPQTIEPNYLPESDQWLTKIDDIRARSAAKNVVSPSSLKGQPQDGYVDELFFVSEGVEETPKEYLGGDIDSGDVASLGNAFHAVMEQIVLMRLVDLSDELKAIITSSLDKYGATQYEERLTRMIEGVLASALLERVFSAGNCWPELAVSDANDEGLIVEGFADLVIQEGEDLTIIDYKTNLEMTQEKIIDYQVQLNVYSKILETASGLKVKQKILWHVLPEKIEEILI
jgi:ATP-dependent exoDNAse (exonuclease V) beta subunit